MGSFGFFTGIFAFIIAIIWICAPFALFGIKPLLREIRELQKTANEQQNRTNWLLEQADREAVNRHKGGPT
jgi:hypothetical protein